MVMRPFRYLEQYCFEGSASYSCVETLQRLCFSMWDGVLLLWLVAWPICSLNCLYLSFHQYLSYERDLKPAVLQSIVALTQGTSVCAHTHTHTHTHVCTHAHLHTHTHAVHGTGGGMCAAVLIWCVCEMQACCSSTCLLRSQPPHPPFAPPPASSAPNHPNHPLLLHLPPQLPTTPTTLCSSTCLLSSQPPQPPFAPPPQLPTTPTTICSSTFLLSSQPPQLPCKWRALR